LGRTRKQESRPYLAGQKQRAEVARALVAWPDLLLADELTVPLDSKTGRDLIELMRRRAVDWCMAALMVTHDDASSMSQTGSRKWRVEVFCWGP
jgi:ABC-type lipoprotein export system ATPase subunit